MIAFFRRLRQSLLAENKTGRYMKYAIGEIILVVIGILIALSINNWNEGQIQQREINGSLSQIFNDLKQDKESLEHFNRKETSHIDYLKGISNNNTTVGLDTILNSLDHYMYFSRSNNGYSGLKDSGKISSIKNEALKSSLTNYYERTYEDLMAASHFSETFTNNRVIPFVIANLEPNANFSTPSELVVEKLKTTDLRSLINYQISVKNYSLRQVKTALEEIFDLNLLIKAELELK